MDVEQWKKTTITRIFHAWLEDWEKELLQVNDYVAEARILEKYKDLLFFIQIQERLSRFGAEI